MEIPVWGNEELGLDKSVLGLGGSPTRVVKVFSPKLSRDTIMKKADGTTAPVDKLEIVMPNGNIVTFGGKNVKDVTGYDIVHLMVGSEGTLGIATKIWLKFIVKVE